MDGAKSLRERRMQEGLSQRELAKALGVAASTVAHYETGRRTPSLPLARKIADFFGVSLDALRFEAEPRGGNNG